MALVNQALEQKPMHPAIREMARQAMKRYLRE